MKRYKVNTDKIANFLTPSIMGGRKNVLWIQSLLYPLRVINNSMQLFFHEKTIESCVTSQVGWFEWYLSEKMKDHFVDGNDMIRIVHYTDNGVPFFYPNEIGLIPYVVYLQGETISSPLPDEEPKALEFKNERTSTIDSSFLVLIPPIKVSENTFGAEIQYHINKYRLGGKTYTIKYQ